MAGENQDRDLELIMSHVITVHDALIWGGIILVGIAAVIIGRKILRLYNESFWH